VRWIRACIRSPSGDEVDDAQGGRRTLESVPTRRPAVGSWRRPIRAVSSSDREEVFVGASGLRILYPKACEGACGEISSGRGGDCSRGEEGY
jgi:hypothetical protein